VATAKGIADTSKTTAQTIRVVSPKPAPIIPLLMMGTGAYLMWFAVHYWRGKGDLVWPSTPLKSVLQGKGLPATSAAQPATAQLAAYETSLSASQQQSSGGGGGGGAPQGPVGSGTAQHTARLLLPKYGWSVSQFGDLLSLWTRESGWSATARNQSSGAFGIAQALGHGGPGTAAPDGTNEYGAQYGLSDAEARQANAGSARWQIEWGLGYIRSRYGSPSAAWAHETSIGWY
jgi:hypothetical protein